MTTRQGQASTEWMRWTRGKHLAHAVRIARQDGVELLGTDHDRKITFEGRTYTPINFAAFSAERREGAFRSGNQEARGWIDGTVITVPDLDANRYRGAEVFQVTLDWVFPWLVYERHRKFIRSVVRDGSSWVGTLEGRTQVLQRPAGGRFGGTFSTTCTYELGDPNTCKKDISADLRTVTVQTVVDPRRVAQFTTASWTGTFVDDYYRDGSLVWQTGDNAGVVSAIVGYTHATRRCDLLLPTPRPIKVGDVAIAKPGCDGLLTTCKTKFANQLNHGGDPFAPAAQQLIEPIREGA